jgi:hypothetical protein
MVTGLLASTPGRGQLLIAGGLTIHIPEALRLSSSIIFEVLKYKSFVCGQSFLCSWVQCLKYFVFGIVFMFPIAF